jgi:hypothetical protein
VMRPPAISSLSRQVVRDQLQRLGVMSRPGLMTAAIIALAVLAWAAQPWHRVPPEAIGMVAAGLAVRRQGAGAG